MENADKTRQKEAEVYGLQERDLLHIRAAASEIAEIETLILFGSRAKGNYRQGSDIDLAIMGQNVTYETVLMLSGDLNEERPLPYFFDVIDYNNLGDEPLREQIDRTGIVLFAVAENAAPLKKSCRIAIGY